jgi:hypothetical protein
MLINSDINDKKRIATGSTGPLFMGVRIDRFGKSTAQLNSIERYLTESGKQVFAFRTG